MTKSVGSPRITVPLSPEEEEILPKLRHLLERSSDVFHALDSLRVKPKTSLAGDDRATPRGILSSQFLTCLLHASDALNAIKIMVNDANAIPAFSAAALTRNAFESVGVAFWMLGPTLRDERVLRSLQLDWESHTDALKLVASIKQETYSAPDALDPTRVRFNQIRDARPALGGKSLKVPSLTDRIKIAQDFIPAPTPSITLYALWNLTSGITHGRKDTIYHVLEKEVLEEWEEGFSARLSTNITFLYPLCGIAQQLLEQAISLFSSRNQPTN